MGRRLAGAARAYFEQAGDLRMVAECLGNEASAAALMQDPATVQIAEGALATCRSVKPVSELLESRLLGVLGNAHVAKRQWEEAIACYEEAIASADVVQDLHRLSLLYSGLSLAHQETGQIGEATRYAQKALTIHETLNDRLSQARSLNNLGYMLVNLGEFVSARRHIDRALRIFEEHGVETQRSIFLMSLAELEFAERDLEKSSHLARQALDLAIRLGESDTAADARTLLGKIAASEGRTAEADEEFAAALVAAEAAGLSSRLTQVHEAYAEVLEARGDLAAANRHLKQALGAYHPTAPGALESRIAIA
jgi:tetratricopeptide (TPR) repeat protein